MLIWLDEHELGSDFVKDKVLQTIKKNRMIEKKDKVLVALSGGPDSMTLLNILNDLKDELDIELGAAHVNHLLRANDAERDEGICRKYCEEKNITFHLLRIDINEMAKTTGMSHEMAGREARYDFFKKVSEENNYNKVAIAHNLNDQAETVLMRIMRGSGSEGLIGIKPVRDEVFIRPLIECSRVEIENYCSDKKLTPAIDKTNYESIYARNKVRLELIPYIEKNFNKDIVKTLNRMSTLLNEDNEFIEEVSNEKFHKWCDKKEDRVIIDSELFNEHKAVVSRAIRKAILSVKGDLYNIESSHINDIIKLYNHNTGKFVLVPGNVKVENVYKNLHIYMQKSNNKNELEFNININERKYCDSIDAYVETKLLEKINNSKLKKSDNVKYFDLDKINGEIKLRYRKDGDKFSPLGMTGTKKLKDIFINMKVPRETRDITPLLCFGNEVGWIVGYKVSEKFKIDKDTKNILMVAIER